MAAASAAFLNAACLLANPATKAGKQQAQRVRGRVLRSKSGYALVIGHSRHKDHFARHAVNAALGRHAIQVVPVILWQLNALKPALGQFNGMGNGAHIVGAIFRRIKVLSAALYPVKGNSGRDFRHAHKVIMDGSASLLRAAEVKWKDVSHSVLLGSRTHGDHPQKID